MRNISNYDFPDTIQVPDGYDMTSIPDLTRDNIIFLMEKHNKLVDYINNIAEHIGYPHDS